LFKKKITTKREKPKIKKKIESLKKRISDVKTNAKKDIILEKKNKKKIKTFKLVDKENFVKNKENKSISIKKEKPKTTKTIEKNIIKERKYLLKKIAFFWSEWKYFILKIFFFSLLLFLLFLFFFTDFLNHDVLKNNTKKVNDTNIITKNINKTDENKTDENISKQLLEETISTFSQKNIFNDNIIYEHVSNFIDIKYFLQNDIVKVIKESKNPNKRYEEILEVAKKQRIKCIKNRENLKLWKNSTRQELEKINQDLINTENNFYLAIEKHNKEKAKKYYDNVQVLREDQKVLRNHFMLNQKMFLMYEFYAPYLLNTEKAIIANKDALILGVEVVDIKNIQIDLIKSEKEWLLENKK